MQENHQSQKRGTRHFAARNHSSLFVLTKKINIESGYEPLKKIKRTYANTGDFSLTHKQKAQNWSQKSHLRETILIMYNKLDISDPCPQLLQVTAYTGFRLGGHIIKADSKNFLLLKSPLREGLTFFNFSGIFSYQEKEKTYVWMLGKELVYVGDDVLGMQKYTMEEFTVCLPFESHGYTVSCVVDCSKKVGCEGASYVAR